MPLNSQNILNQNSKVNFNPKFQTGITLDQSRTLISILRTPNNRHKPFPHTNLTPLASTSTHASSSSLPPHPYTAHKSPYPQTNNETDPYNARCPAVPIAPPVSIISTGPNPPDSPQTASPARDVA